MSSAAPPAKHWLIAEKRPPLPPPGRGHRSLRKAVHLACFLVFVLLPFTNLLRIDIPRQRVFLGGFEILISEFSILFFATMFLMFVVAAMAIVYGRIYCSYACPQMIFSEWSAAVQGWAGRVGQRLAKGHALGRKLVGRGLFLAVLAAASVFLAFVFTSYFVEPRDLARRLAHFDLKSVGGITGASVTLLTFLDFTLVRQKFCTSICPYGYLQGFLQDRQSLLVAYQDPTGACIDCQRCVRVCAMQIDIRKGPFQIECVHCGDCIDACDEVLARVGHPGLIHYAWGAGPAGPARRESWLKRIGLRDAKRWAILGVLAAYLGALLLALGLRKPVQIRITPDRATLFQVLADGRVANQVRMDLANRSSRTVQVKVWVQGLPGAQVHLDRNPLELAPGATLERTFAVSAPAAWPGAQELNPIQVLIQSSDRGEPETAEMMFILPATRK